MTSRPRLRSFVAIVGGIALLAAPGAAAREQMVVVDNDIDPTSSRLLDEVAVLDLTAVELRGRSRGNSRSGKGSELFAHPDASRPSCGVVDVTILGSASFHVTNVGPNRWAPAGGSPRLP